VLKVSVTCRRGVSPREATRAVESTLAAFDDLLGLPVPVLIQISGGFRARVSSASRAQQPLGREPLGVEPPSREPQGRGEDARPEDVPIDSASV